MSKKREEVQKALSTYSDLDMEDKIQKLIDTLSETEVASQSNKLREKIQQYRTYV